MQYVEIDHDSNVEARYGNRGELRHVSVVQVGARGERYVARV